MSNTKPLLIIIVLVLIGLFSWIAFSNNDNMADIMEDHMDDEMIEEMEEEMEEMMGNSDTGFYTTYSPSKLALANTNDVVLFFNATWCPTCRALVRDIEDNLSNIPEGVVILSVDYDTFTNLRQKYGVTYQHTFVQVDSSGNQIHKWASSATLRALLSEIK